MRELVERGFDARGIVASEHARGRGHGRTATVNLAESPLGWLRSRRLVDARQFEAGERLRADYERAALAPSVTMRWEARVDGGGGDALDGAGRGLSDVLWRVICAGEGLPVAERGLGWPQRSGRVVLTIALDRLADHYGLG